MINKRVCILGIFIITLGWYGFSEEIEAAYRDSYQKITEDFSIYEKYLPRSRLIQLQAIRKTLEDNETFDINHILRISKAMIDACDKIVLQSLMDRLDITEQKYQKIQTFYPQLQAQYAEFTKKHGKTSELTRVNIEETEAFIHQIDTLYSQVIWGSVLGPAYRGNMSGDRYLVEEGDSLRKIAETKYGNEMKWPLIYHANSSIINPDLIYPGMEFFIPPQQ